MFANRSQVFSGLSVSTPRRGEGGATRPSSSRRRATAGTILQTRGESRPRCSARTLADHGCRGSGRPQVPPRVGGGDDLAHAGLVEALEAVVPLEVLQVRTEGP